MIPTANDCLIENVGGAWIPSCLSGNADSHEGSHKFLCFVFSACDKFFKNSKRLRPKQQQEFEHPPEALVFFIWRMWTRAAGRRFLKKSGACTWELAEDQEAYDFIEQHVVAANLQYQEQLQQPTTSALQQQGGKMVPSVSSNSFVDDRREVVAGCS